MTTTFFPPAWAVQMQAEAEQHIPAKCRCPECVAARQAEFEAPKEQS